MGTTPVALPDPAGEELRLGPVDTLSRPWKCARLEAEVHAAVPALRPWLVGPDLRLKTFAVGALWAFKWTCGIDATTPVTREELASPNFRELLAECAMAALVAAGTLPSPASGWTESGRLLARGSETWLLWWLWAGSPLPVLLTPGVNAAEVAADLGDVGLSAAGLAGPVSDARFPALPGARLVASAT